LLTHAVLRAAARARPKTGIKMDDNIATTAITTSSSTNVKPFRVLMTLTPYALDFVLAGTLSCSASFCLARI
jgi:hypothetical protein